MTVKAYFLNFLYFLEPALEEVDTVQTFTFETTTEKQTLEMNSTTSDATTTDATTAYSTTADATTTDATAADNITIDTTTSIPVTVSSKTFNIFLKFNKIRLKLRICLCIDLYESITFLSLNKYLNC